MVTTIRTVPGYTDRTRTTATVPYPRSGDECSTIAVGQQSPCAVRGIAAQQHGQRAGGRRHFLHTRVFGPQDGYPIVLSHGFTCAIRVWDYQIADLTADYRVIAFDHRGHGRSGLPPRGGYSLSHLASDLDAVLEATLRPGERAVLAGHSMGASRSPPGPTATATRSRTAPMRSR